jgi:hypothetical protein
MLCALLLCAVLSACSEPFLVTQDNIEEFNRYANTKEGLKRDYLLTEDIVLKAPEPETSNWTPIGRAIAISKDDVFNGTFDGNGHTITGLRIHATEDASPAQGLFSYIGPKAVIQNLGLKDVRVVVVGSNMAGAVVGSSSGTVKNCYSEGEVRGGTAGGVVGSNGGTVQNSYFEGEVKGGNWGGGVVGSNTSRVQNSYSTGSVTGGGVVGGVVGLNWSGAVQNSYATGSVMGNGGNGARVGGVVGMNFGQVRNCYATGGVNGIGDGSMVGGVVGSSIENSKVENCVALNPITTTTADTADKLGRVVGENDKGTLENNHARDDMRLIYSYARDHAFTGSATGKDGAGTSAYNSEGFWSSTMQWNFSTDWEWREGHLPTLRNVGGEQTPTAQTAP